MTDQIEEYEARKRLRRSRFRWRVIAVVAVLALIGTILAQMDGPQKATAHIARYEVSGIIASDPDRDDLLAEIAEDDNAKALILRIDSPGGTVTGSEALYDSLRDIAGKKPVVAVMSELAASGGYIAALAADHVLARGSTITGSVGVVFQAPNAAALLDRIGVQMVEIKSGPLKAQPSPFQPIDPQVIAAEQELVEDSFRWFIGLVEQRRGLGGNALAEIGQGGVYTGRMAREIGLIDALGGEDEAVEWLEAERGIEADLTIADYEVEIDEDSPLDLLLGLAGFEPGRGAALRRLTSPGLLALYVR